MSQQQREHISALADGELGSDLIKPTITALEANPDLRVLWERYSLIGSALRGETVKPEYRQIAARVRQQLETEPLILNPASAARPPSRSNRPARSATKRGHYGGIALAASAAFLAVFALPRYFSPTLDPNTSPTLALTMAPASTVVSAPTTAPTESRFLMASKSQASELSPRWHLAEPSLESKLDRFLVTHQASSPASGIKGLFPYATVVGYEAGR